MAKIHILDQLVAVFLELNPGSTELMARNVAKQIDRGMQAAVLADWKAQVKLRVGGRQALPLVVDQTVEASGKVPARPAKAVRETKKPYTLLLPPTMLEALTERANEDGASVSHHIRAAIAVYLGKGKR